MVAIAVGCVVFVAPSASAQLLSDYSLGTLSLGDSVSGNNGASANVLNGTLGWGDGSWSGGDDIYTLNITSDLLLGGLLLEFIDENGDLDLILWDADDTNGGDELASSLSVTDNESIDLTGLTAGTYWAHIDGWSGASNDYTLSLSGTAVPEPGTLGLVALLGLALSAFGLRKRLG